jgi:hypothetical protein
MDVKDCYSISLRSASSASVIAPAEIILSDQSTDEFELLEDSDEEADDNQIIQDDADGRSQSTTSVSDSVFAHEYDHGRRYHHFRSGVYPFPNDLPEHAKEEALHHLMLEVTVS